MAESLYLRAHELDPNNKTVYVELGKLYGNFRYWDLALAVWEKGINHFPSNHDVFSNLIDKLQHIKDKK